MAPLGGGAAARGFSSGSTAVEMMVRKLPAGEGGGVWGTTNSGLILCFGEGHVVIAEWQGIEGAGGGDREEAGCVGQRG